MARVKRALVRDPPPTQASEATPAQPPNPPQPVATAMRTPTSRRQPVRKGKRVPIPKKKKGESSTVLIDEDAPSPPPSPSLPLPSTTVVDAIPPKVPIAAPPLQMVPSSTIIPFTDHLKI
ncbi:classical arabinogalactan protein 9-like [Cynara cardunculus var. scolymus]|uniref:classical arabinogalactan protein 9-like n=1 Tax=Cynara cardunculus var. scolymus TaxID=59895 RepID=UPI000D62B1CF|nr:classical arabinogalactan protein 9-like [Cynara cardunculus var. scolymus]